MKSHTCMTWDGVVRPAALGEYKTTLCINALNMRTHIIITSLVYQFRKQHPLSSPLPLSLSSRRTHRLRALGSGRSSSALASALGQSDKESGSALSYPISSRLGSTLCLVWIHHFPRFTPRALNRRRSNRSSHSSPEALKVTLHGCALVPR